ncbi:MAG TPA: hypothetical protein VIL72_14705, partial [Beijerinckiaceae bacterium]
RLQNRKEAGMRWILLIGALALAGAAQAQGAPNLGSATSSTAPAPPPGATSCTGCHGAPGGALPSLQGQSAEAISGAMAAFRSGERPATLMNRIAKGFSDEESRAIGVWLAAQGGAK